jgi:hypothetical protein
MHSKLIYIASRYSDSEEALVVANVDRQCRAANRIIDMGHVPYAPNLNHYFALHKQRSYEEWLRIDFEIIGRCDILLRLPGSSPGADREVEYALSLGIPVAHGFMELSCLLCNMESNVTVPQSL